MSRAKRIPSASPPGVIFYGAERHGPLAIKEAWEKAKERAAAILKGNTVETRETQLTLEYEPATKRSFKRKSIEKKRKAESLNCRFHDLRHTAVTRLLEAGTPYPVVASMMGGRLQPPYAWPNVTATLEARRSAKRPMSGAIQHSCRVPQKVPKVG